MEKKTKNILIAVGTGVGLLGGYLVYRHYKNKAQINSQIKAVTTGGITTLGINIPEIAYQIGLDLGTAYSAIDPRHWTENDDKVKVSVLKVPKPLIPTLMKEYAKRFNRNLQADLQSQLDDWNEVSYLFS